MTHHDPQPGPRPQLPQGARLHPDEWRALLDLARSSSCERTRSDEHRQQLAEANIALIFEKASTRTRCAFEVAAHDQGAHVTYLDPGRLPLGHKESVKDTARVLGRIYDGIEYRGYRQETVETLASYAGVPVWNGLTDEWHPTQSLCDVLTMREHADKPDTRSRSPTSATRTTTSRNSLLVAGAMMGMDVRMVGAAIAAQPRGRASRPPQDIADETGARITHTDDPREGVAASTSSTPTSGSPWASPRRPGTKRIALLLPYQVNRGTARQHRQPRRAKFMHCLPAFHDRETEVGEELFATTGLDALRGHRRGLRVAEHSIVFDQAENRMHTIKAVMVATAGPPRTGHDAMRSLMLPD